MSMATNFIFFAIVLSVFAQVLSSVGLITPPATALNAILTYGSTGQFPTDFPLYALFLTILGAVGLGFLGTIAFPNQFAIFAGITLALLTTFLVVPFQLFSILPEPFGLMLTSVFGFGVFWGFLNWYKGGGEP